MMDDLSPGDRLLASMTLKSAFHDRHERRAYERSIEIARRIVNEPAIIQNADAFLERHMRYDAHQARYYVLWRSVLGLPAEAIARALLEDSDRGAELRGSAPVFVVIEPSYGEDAFAS